MLSVTDQVEQVEEDLDARRLRCPDCGFALARWGFARRRTLRGLYTSFELRPRRTRCTGCGGTHVLLPNMALARRRDTAAVVGRALQARASGLGYRRIAALLPVPFSTIRGWLRRIARNATLLMRAFEAIRRSGPRDPSSVPVAERARLHRARSSAPDAARWRTASIVQLVEDASMVVDRTARRWEFASEVTGGTLLLPRGPDPNTS